MGNLVRQPSRRQVAAARIVTAWYMRMYYRTEEDVGVPEMFCRRDRVGHFAVDRPALAAGTPSMAVARLPFLMPCTSSCTDGVHAAPIEATSPMRTSSGVRFIATSRHLRGQVSNSHFDTGPRASSILTGSDGTGTTTAGPFPNNSKS